VVESARSSTAARTSSSAIDLEGAVARTQSAGTLLYRRSGDAIEVLIVHPSGNYNRRAPWSIPKGVPDEGESLEDAARRETREETGIEPDELTEIGFIDYQKSRKRVFCFAGPAPTGASNEPRCASWEVDKAEFVAVEVAAERLHPDQVPFLARLADLIIKGGAPVAGAEPIP
jgi:predicted NUDIX family NTP pyrophosphohydrolase